MSRSFLRTITDDLSEPVFYWGGWLLGLILYVAVARVSYSYLGKNNELYAACEANHGVWCETDYGPRGPIYIGSALWPVAVPIVFAVRNYQMVLIGTGGLVGLGVIGVGGVRVGFGVRQKLKERTERLNEKLRQQERLADEALRQAAPKLARELEYSHPQDRQNL